MTVDLEAHAEAIARLFIGDAKWLEDHVRHWSKDERLITACAALFDAGALAMREAAAVETAGSYDVLDAVRRIRALDPASLRMKGPEHAAL